MTIVYLSTPYSHEDPVVKQKRYNEACLYAAKLHELGYAVISPIIQCIPIVERHKLKDDYATWEATCKALLRISDFVVIAEIDGWENSIGVTNENLFAHQLGKRTVTAKINGEKLSIYNYFGDKVYEEFTITEDHCALARRFNIVWDDHSYFGSPKADNGQPYVDVPEVDQKRPYGNKWPLEHDIPEILGWEGTFKDDETIYSSEQIKQAERLHREMEKVLQIAVFTGKFEPGTYQKINEFCNTWVKKLSN